MINFRIFQYFLAFTVVGLLIQCSISTSTRIAPQKSAISDSGMVVTAHPEASAIGKSILAKGGNAADASIAVQFALAVCYPVAGNIGGGGFMMHRNDLGEIISLDYREKAPKAAFEAMYQDEEGNVNHSLSKVGPLAAGVPGSVDGMVEIYEKLSKMKDWAALLQPAIDLAENGFLLTQRQAELLNSQQDLFAITNTTENPFTRKKEFKEGETFIQKELAETLKRIQKYGRDGFYSGPVADAIVEACEKSNGIITYEDLQSYSSVWREPISTKYRGYTVHSMGPPSSGGIVLSQLLNGMEPYILNLNDFHSVKAIHLMTELEKRAYADRAKHIGDSDFYNVPINVLTSKAYMSKRMESFQLDKATPTDLISHGTMPAESEETTHFSIVDKDGNAVSITTTLNGAYGSNYYVNGAGFLLNNEMDDFSVKPGTPNLYGLVGGEANKIEPEKRMLSSMTPTIVEDSAGQLFLVVGSPGGSTIITSVFQVIVNMVDFEMTVEEAVQKPRFHHQWKPEDLFIEKNALSKELIQQLETMGHIVTERSDIGRVEAILYKNDQLIGAADRRGDDDARGL